jgi:hypothetical protein
VVENENWQLAVGGTVKEKERGKEKKKTEENRKEQNIVPKNCFVCIPCTLHHLSVP